jgi:hypothetical protein
MSQNKVLDMMMQKLEESLHEIPFPPEARAQIQKTIERGKLVVRLFDATTEQLKVACEGDFTEEAICAMAFCGLVMQRYGKMVEEKRREAVEALGLLTMGQQISTKGQQH